ncbi:hypothetical protein MRX96_003476 [Rhipicephalus microplus]
MAAAPRCCTVDGVVAFIGVVIHVLEFFAFWYLLAAFFILTGDSHRPDDHFCALKRRKAYILPWIVTSIVECALLFKCSIFLGLHAWITATTVAFSSVQVGRSASAYRPHVPHVPAQLFYVSCVVLYFRRLKKMEREIQPPEVYKCF